MNTNDLKIFESVAVNASFTKAAEEMFTVQSNITARIKNLESELKIELFTRTSRKVILTEEGKIFLTYSRKINSLANEVKELFSAPDRLSGILNIGCIETTMALKVPGVINHFTNQYPGVTLNFSTGTSIKLISDVLNFKLDAAFVVAPIFNPELSSLVIKEEKLSIISSVNQRDLGHLGIQPVKIVVFDQGCSYRQRLETWLSNQGIFNYQCTILNTLEGIINFVEAGVGITVLPEELIRKHYDHRQLNSHPLEGDLSTLTTVLINRIDIALPKTLQMFKRYFENDAVIANAS
ncbi:LysR family transcriptional regulator [Pedobacter lusitanus]|uniref:LysR family transcriptional regulator n=1 Tax=Pedobacter lusitanus TaxID=1503925 RepID=A0A0D0G1A4_9SPHI|nr:LysR family transcriptional regulator [Pedobacter lusitanus]KIO78579.1 LysR family transcriptional regulator [Pedobacter lusitanus]